MYIQENVPNGSFCFPSWKIHI